MGRYSKNMKMLTPEENSKLGEYKVCVIGCGGLGGYIVEMLARLGIGFITAVDGDVFEETNLNRQLLSNMITLGKNKAEAAKQRVEVVNPLVHIRSINERISESNAHSILEGHDVIVDAVDNIHTRFLIQREAEKLNTPFIHGAIAGWYGQVSTILPGDNTLEHIYPSKDIKGMEQELGNPSFTPALVASIQVSEVLKVLINRGELLRGKVLLINTFDQSYELIEMNI
ncbi:HesA/MoeB/ThiF family protein [Brassicibacter mesophilus]|uniref:HesA/MoeB/ThiF family protein n=1 Tax=Brassicibacter mesophilus TaxID=745119 RepID=UPI003D21B8DB